MNTIELDKLAVAREQLDAAIELFFASDNLIAVHTLTAAAYNVLRDLALKQGSEFPFIKTGFLATLKSSEKKAALAYLNAPENFFKHADKDPNGILQFDPRLTELMLLDACSYFKDKAITQPRHFDAIKAWAGTPRKEVLANNPDAQMAHAFLETLRASGKQVFWEWYCKLHAAKKKSPELFAALD